MSQANSNRPSCRDTLFVKVISGSLGSTLTALVVTPLEVIKVRQQFQSPNPPPPPTPPPIPAGATKRACCGTFVLNNGLNDCVLPKNAVPYFNHQTGQLKESARVSNSRGMFAMLRSIWATEGSAGIYAGLRPTLAMAVPNTVLYFASYEEIKEYLDVNSTYFSHSTIPAVAGASARVVATIGTAPLELIRTRQAAQVGSGQVAEGLLEEFRTMIRQEGVASLYKGLSPTLLRDVPFSAMYWFTIEYLRTMWGDSSTVSASAQAGQAVFNGSVAGMVAAAATTPLDVVKTRLQVVKEPVAVEAVACGECGSISYHPSTKPQTPPSTFSVLAQVLHEEGVTGLWRGNQARMLKIAPACAIMLSSYEMGKRLLTTN
eukprot:Nitzschia sp. Nitz4//scaffold13_size275219//71213//72334//NITZ4_000857-RA/size275219-processed-gene-0.78-mRNA-1//1//CDS//3329535963//5733//frame0